MEKVITCELSFIPIKSEDYKREVDEVLEIISSSGLEYQVGLMSTSVTGSKDLIFGMLRRVFDQMESKSKFTMIVKISNECGCG